MTMADQTLSRASAALAGALASDDPEAVRHFTAIITECSTRSELSLAEFERRVIEGLDRVLGRSTARIAERTVGMADEAEVAGIVRTELFAALASAGRRVLT
jgi:DNA-binding phage protein